MPVYADFPVVSVGEWQSAQPIAANTAAPFCVDEVAAAGVGGADRRATSAKLTASDDMSEAEPVFDPPSLSICVLSSGLPLNTQPGTALRSLGNNSFATPISTLYASPEKMSNDLFCAFQPKRVMVPSLPLLLKEPPIPSDARALAVALRLSIKAWSGVASTSPSPNIGVGMRKITLFCASAAAKFGWARLQPGASERPRIV